MPVTQYQPHPVNERRALGYAMSAVLLWSTVATGFKLGLAVLAVEQLLLLGTFISWLVFLGYAAIADGFRLAPGDRRLVLIQALINPITYYLVLFAAYDRLPAHIAQPLNYTWAIALAVLAVPILKQPLKMRALAGIVISYAGVTVLLMAGAEHHAGGWDVTGVALALLSTVLWAGYWLLNTRAQSAPGALMFWSFSAALPLLAGVCALGPGLPELNITNLGYGAWVGCIEMGITFLLWQHALRSTANAGRIGQLIFLAPFLSLIIIHHVLGEKIAAGVIPGLAIIVLGLYLARHPDA